MREIKRALAPVKRRMRAQRALAWGAWGALAAGACVVGLRIVSFARMFETMWIWAACAAAGLTGGLVLNIGAVLLAGFFDKYHLIVDMDTAARIFSVLSLAAIGYFLWVCGDICLRGRIVREKQPAKEEEEAGEARLQERRQLKQNEILARLSGDAARTPKWNLKESLLLLALTVVYAVVAFVYLGDTNVPQSYWRAGGGAVAEVTFSEPVSIASVWTYGGISKGKLLLSSSQDASEEETVSTANARIAEISESFLFTLHSLSIANVCPCIKL